MHAAGYSPSVNVLLFNLSRTSRRSSSSMAWFSSALSFRTLTGSCSCVTSRGISCHDLSVLVSAVCVVSWIAMWGLCESPPRGTVGSDGDYGDSVDILSVIFGKNADHTWYEPSQSVNIDQPANSACPQSLLTATPLAKSVTPVGSVRLCSLSSKSTRRDPSLPLCLFPFAVSKQQVARLEQRGHPHAATGGSERPCFLLQVP
jgi:hypothetical protein